MQKKHSEKLNCEKIIAQQIRDSVLALNMLLISAARHEVDVEFEQRRDWDKNEPTQLRVYISQPL